MMDSRNQARAIVNRQVHAIQQNARDNNAPFGFYGGATKRVRGPRNTSQYKLRGTNTRRITAETSALRNHMPSRTVIRNRLVAAFRAHGLESVPFEIVSIAGSIIEDLTTTQRNMMNRPEVDPAFATEYFIPAPRKPRAPRAPRVSIVEPSLELAPALEPAKRPKMSDATKKAMKAGRERAKRARAENARLTKKRAAMRARGIIQDE